MLKDKQRALGGIFAPYMGVDSVAEFPDGSESEYSTTKRSACLMDRSWLGRIDVSGADRLEFLHRMSTNDIRALMPGDGLQTVLTTPEAKIIDLLTVYAKPESLLCVTSPQNCAKVLTWFKRNIFFRDKVKALDLSPLTIQLSLFGPRAAELLKELTGEDVKALSLYHARTLIIAGCGVLVARLPGIAGDGYDLISESAYGDELWDAVLDSGTKVGLQPLGTTAYNALRLEAGEPLYGYELGEDVNPLEANLKHAISFAKGCYTGQEVIARLDTYQKLKQTLVRLRLSELPGAALPLALWAGDTEVGKLTSAARLPGTADVIGLGYVRVKFYQPGAIAVVKAGEQTIDVTLMPQTDEAEAVAA